MGVKQSALARVMIMETMIVQALELQSQLKLAPPGKRERKVKLAMVRGGSWPFALDLGKATNETAPLAGSSGRMIPAIMIEMEEKEVKMKESLVSKYELSSELNCPLRDLHFIDNLIPSVSMGGSKRSKQQLLVFPEAFCFLVRENYIVLHMDHVRLLIRAHPNEILLFPSPFDSAEKSSLWELVRDIVDQIRSTPSGTNLFPLIAIDATLSRISSRYSAKAGEVLSLANELLECIHPSSRLLVSSSETAPEKQPSPKENFMERQRKLGLLLRLKNRVDELESSVADIAAEIADVLKEDDDIAVLSRLGRAHLPLPNTRRDHIEVELLLEDYLLTMEGIRHSLRSIQANILNTEEVINIELDLIRNRIMQYEVVFSVAGLVLGVAAAVTGLFGMNLLSHFEFHLNMFYKVTLSLLLSMAALAFALIHRLMADHIW